MRRVQFGAGSEEEVLILGFGNRLKHHGVQWLIDQPTAAEYAVTAFEIPRTITDFEAEYLAPVRDYASPTFLREARRAQESIPPFDADDLVFTNPEDAIVGTDAIEAQTPAANRIQFDGGHELFCSRSRDEHVDALLDAVAGGVAGGVAAVEEVEA